jgi:hypothetical protein
MTGQS